MLRVIRQQLTKIVKITVAVGKLITLHHSIRIYKRVCVILIIVTTVRLHYLSLYITGVLTRESGTSAATRAYIIDDNGST